MSKDAPHPNAETTHGWRHAPGIGRVAKAAPSDDPALERFWSLPAERVLALLGSSIDGLDAKVASERLRIFGRNSVAEQVDLSTVRLLVRQFESPLVLILIFAACISLFLREWIDAGVILSIILGSALLGFYQEFRASKAVAELKSRLALSVKALRNGRRESIAATALVPGDIVLLSAGNLIPADGVILESSDFLVTEASLTGESFPVEKRVGIVAADAPIGERSNSIFLGTSVRSGTTQALIVHTGRTTAFGAIAARLESQEPETDFARGVRHFGQMVVRMMFLIVLSVLIINQLVGRPFADSLLFSVALAVGLSPELLPAIISVTLSAGARHLAKGGVIVRRLEAIENLGSMDVLCTDKTGTLSTGDIALEDAVDTVSQSSAEVKRLAFLNATLETGIENPLDAALVAAGKADSLTTDGFRKVAEMPYDFMRRRLTVVVEEGTNDKEHRLICKGAFAEVIAICDTFCDSGKTEQLTDTALKRFEDLFRSQSEAGYRVLAVAERRVPARPSYSRDDEAGLTFVGLLLFLDPPKPDAFQTIHDLAALGIAVKIISGDNRYVTAHLAKTVGLDPTAMLTGTELAVMSDDALWHAVAHASLFVEIDPQQKERIVRALQRAGHSVGYMGDGINDAPALRSADVGISVDQAVDVARESSDVILLQRDLNVLRQGIEDGRRTFANSLKYISITTSANFGNMISMAIATPFLPFLPLLPKQILLNNFLSDLPSMAISTDNVDRDQVLRPQRWNVKELKRFMIVFGLVSSCFDLLTFAVLLLVFHAQEETFQTVWFVVSLLTELAVVLVLRTHKPMLRSRPSSLLFWTTVSVGLFCLAIPYLPAAGSLFSFSRIPLALAAFSVLTVCGYIAATEFTKAMFYRPQRLHSAPKKH